MTNKLEQRAYRVYSDKDDERGLEGQLKHESHPEIPVEEAHDLRVTSLATISIGTHQRD